MEIDNDPFGRLASLEGVIIDFSRTSSQKIKDSSIIVSEKPSSYYSRESASFNESFAYYNDLLDNVCPNDEPLELSAHIRKARDAYYSALRKLIQRIEF